MRSGAHVDPGDSESQIPGHSSRRGWS